MFEQRLGSGPTCTVWDCDSEGIPAVEASRSQDVGELLFAGLKWPNVVHTNHFKGLRWFNELRGSTSIAVGHRFAAPTVKTGICPALNIRIHPIPPKSPSHPKLYVLSAPEWALTGALWKERRNCSCSEKGITIARGDVRTRRLCTLERVRDVSL